MYIIARLSKWLHKVLSFLKGEAFLTKNAILQEIALGNLKIDPPPPEEAFNGASIDLEFAPWVRRFLLTDRTALLFISHETDLNEISWIQDLTEWGYLILEPFEFVHVMTRRWISLGPNLCAFMKGRSHTARFDLQVDITADLMHPGSSGPQTIEMRNPWPFRVVICLQESHMQLIVARCTRADDIRNGRYAQQTLPCQAL